MKVNTFQVFTVLFVCAGLFQSCDETQRASVFRSAATPITVLQPTSIDVPQSYVADVQAIQFVEVKPKVEGFVQQILVDEGQKVSKGQALFRLSSEEYAEQVKEAEANFKQAEAGYQMAEYESERIGRMVEKNIIAKIRLDQANTEKEVARMKVDPRFSWKQIKQGNTDFDAFKYSGYS